MLPESLENLIHMNAAPIYPVAVKARLRFLQSLLFLAEEERPTHQGLQIVRIVQISQSAPLLITPSQIAYIQITTYTQVAGHLSSSSVHKQFCQACVCLPAIYFWQECINILYFGGAVAHLSGVECELCGCCM